MPTVGPGYFPQAAAASGDVVVGTTAITGGVSGKNLFNDGGVIGERTDFEGPGSWSTSNIPASANTSLGRNGSGTSNNTWLCPVAGTITHLSVDWQGDITAGTGEIQVLLDGVAQTAAGSVLSCAAAGGIGGSSRYFSATLATPIAVAAETRVSMRVVSASLAPTTLDPIADLGFKVT